MMDYFIAIPPCVPSAGVNYLEANVTAQYFESPNYPNNYNRYKVVSYYHYIPIFEHFF